jgi:hypothetical protein
VDEEEARGPQLHQPPARLERTEEWEFLQNLVISMPTKMQEVIDWEGEWPDISIVMYKNQNINF